MVEVNDPPKMVVPTQTITVDEDEPVLVPNLVLIDDVSQSNLNETYKLVVGCQHCSLGVRDGAFAVVVKSNGTGQLEIFANLGDMNRALKTLVYVSSRDYHGRDTISFNVSELGGKLKASNFSYVVVKPVNDAPEITQAVSLCPQTRCDAKC